MPLRPFVCSGGQTGVDRAALDAALRVGLGTGGWGPKDRCAEDRKIRVIYPLRETATADPSVRTELNILASDGTLILFLGEPQDGTVFTRRCVQQHGQLVLEVDLAAPPSPNEVRDWIASNDIRTLKVAGPRESHKPGSVYRSAFAYLLEVFTRL